MTKKLTPREREMRQLSRQLAKYEEQMAADRRARRSIPSYAIQSMRHLRDALKRMSKQTDGAFEAWQLR
jgi:predicted aspartyl protease